jgi:cytochrome c oxidase assembly protein subunit 15
VDAVTAPLARARRLGVRAVRFRTLALAACGALYVIVATGATVRLTASGLGCEHWPGCSAGNPFPQKGYHSFIEFGNRMVGGLTIALTLLVWLAARRTPRLPPWSVRLALALFLGTLAQAPLGAITVYLNLHPLIVIPHLLLSIALLGAAVVLAIEGLRLERGSAEPALPEEGRRLGTVVAAACFALIVSGTFATAAGPHSGGDDVARFGTLGVALVVHAAAVAVFGLGVVFLLGYLFAARERAPGLFRGTVALVALVLVQMALGELQYRTHLPWGLVLVHVALAAAVWAGAVALATLLRRPLGVRATAVGRI